MVIKSTSSPTRLSSDRSDSLDKFDDNKTLHDNGVHLINGEFDYFTADDTITWILESGFRKKKPKHLTLIINSHGGEMASAFAIIDIMRGSPIPIHTVGIGQVSSAGLMTFMAGAKGHRILTPNTTILSHIWSGETCGNAHELLAAQRENDLSTERMINHYQRCTGLSVDIIRDKLLPTTDVWLSAEEARGFNICDHIKYMD